jgi:O-antigen ligase/polysaccharide polymerase Wzy-like membrane protein
MKSRPGTVALASALAGVAVCALLALTGTRTDVSIALGVAAAIAGVALARPFAGYCALLAIALLSDLYLSHFSPWTDQLGFYVFSNWWTLLSLGEAPRLRFLVADCVDGLLIAISIGLAWRVLRKQVRLTLSPDVALGVLLVAALCAMLAFGLASGGDFKPALWQARPFFYFAVFALLGSQLVRGRREVEQLVAVIVVVSAIKAVQIDWLFFVDAGHHFGSWRSIVGHEDSIFLSSVIVLATAYLLYRGPLVPRTALLIAAALCTTAVVLNLRRTAYVALALSVLSMPILLHGRRRAALALTALALVGGAAYAAVGLSRPEAWWAAPALKAKAIVAPDSGSTDSASNVYRVAENYNLRATIAAHPLGMGFGHPFELHMPIDDISYLLPLWRYHPHNIFLGVWIALGAIGYTVLLSYCAVALMLASHSVRWHTDPGTKALAYFVLAAIASGLFASVFDQFIWVDRGALFLGAMVAMAAALHRSLPSPTRPG